MVVCYCLQLENLQKTYSATQVELSVTQTENKELQADIQNISDILQRSNTYLVEVINLSISRFLKFLVCIFLEYVVIEQYLQKFWMEFILYQIQEMYKKVDKQLHDSLVEVVRLKEEVTSSSTSEFVANGL